MTIDSVRLFVSGVLHIFFMILQYLSIFCMWKVSVSLVVDFLHSGVELSQTLKVYDES